MRTIAHHFRSHQSVLMLTAITLFLAMMVGYLLTSLSPFQSIILALLLLVFVCTFIWPEGGLYVVIFSMLLSPEVIVGQVGGGATLGRGLTLRLEDFLLVFIGLSWFARTAIDKSMGLIRKTSLNLPIATYILISLLATLWGKLTGSVQGMAGLFFVLKYFEYMLVFFMVVNYVNTEAQVKRLLFCLLLTCFIVSIYGLVQIPSGIRISAPFEGAAGEPNTFGGYLLLMGAVAGALLDRLKDMRVRLGLVLLLVVLFVSLLYTLSRASYLGVIPAYVVIALCSRKRLYLIAGLIIALLLSPALAPSSVKQRIVSTVKPQQQPGQVKIGSITLDTSTSARVRSWKIKLQDWRKRPFVGYGITGSDFMDSQYLRVLVETGIVGMLAFIWLIYALYRVGILTLKEHRGDLLTGLAVGLVAGLTGLLVHAIGANTFIIVRIMEPFWCLVGILIALSAIHVEREIQIDRVSAPST